MAFSPREHGRVISPRVVTPTERRNSLRSVWLILAILLSWAGTASAGSKHHCACSEHCNGTSCCCKSDDESKAEPKPVVKADFPVPAPRATPEGPCVGRAPCGRHDLPGPSAVGSIARAAVLTAAVPREPEPSSRLRATSAAPCLPARLVSRLDDPPEA
jgi:hypothetical protein